MRVGGRGRDEGRGGDEGVPVISGGWCPVPMFPFVSSAPHSTVGGPGGMRARYFILPYTHSPIPMSHHHVVEHVETQRGLGTAGIWLTSPPPPHGLPSILALCSESTTFKAHVVSVCISLILCLFAHLWPSRLTFPLVLLWFWSS